MIGTIRQRVAASVLALSALGVGAIVKHEGMMNAAYVDPVGVVTVCAGHTRTAKLGQKLSDERCAQLLLEDSEYAQAAVRRLVTTKITQAQFDALTSLVFNIGEGNFASSTLLRKLNAGDCWGAGAQFPRWNKGRVKGKLVVLPGLTTRRADERKTFETGCSRENQASINSSVLAWAERSPAPLPTGRPALDADRRWVMVVSA
jgi:lysozyme